MLSALRSSATLLALVATAAGACDAPAKAGDELSMQYTGTIDASSQAGTPGQQFDSTASRGNEPFTFTLGQGQVIQGWDEGLLGACPGESKTLVIPPEKGYGDQGAGADIPGGATLNFAVTVESINGETGNTAGDSQQTPDPESESDVKQMLRGATDNF